MKGTRTASKLSDLLHHQLDMYALAASAAGVGALALSQPAEGKIIYTKTNAGVYTYYPYPLDLNNDGIADFYFSGFWTNTTAPCVGVTGYLKVVQARFTFNAIVSVTGARQRFYAAALPAGIRVGNGARFGPKGSMGAIYQNTCNKRYYYHGLWENGGKGVKNRYLGLRFREKGELHYGWARLNFPRNPRGAMLTGYAYETIPNKAIITGKTKGPDVISGQPGSLGRLALGRK